MEQFKILCVFFFMVWQLSSFCFGTYWLFTFLKYVVIKHCEHVDMVKENRVLIEQVIDHLRGDIIPSNEYRDIYVRFPSSLRGKK